MRWSLRSPRSLQRFKLTLIGGFTSPLYLNTGSGETGVQYPNDAAQGGWVGVKKTRYTPRLFSGIEDARLNAALKARDFLRC